MSKLNNDSNENIPPTQWEKIAPRIRKIFHSTAVIALLLPNIMTISVAAQEMTAEEPVTEEVELVEEPAVEEEVVEDTTPEEPVAEEEIEDEGTLVEDTTPEEPVTEEEAPAVPETPEEVTAEEPVEVVEPVEAAPAAQVANDDFVVAQVSGIVQENLVYENGTLTLHNQVEGTNIAAVLPNDSLIYATVPFHGRWSPRQNLERNKIYVGDEIEFFTYNGTELGESVTLNVQGDGETRPDDAYAKQYGWSHFGFVPTLNDSRITYRTEPFFTVEMTFPNGVTLTNTANSLGQVAFPFEDANYTPRPGQQFSVRVFDRNGVEVDLDNLDLFRPLTTPNQSTTRILGEEVIHTVNINAGDATINDEYVSTEVSDGMDYELQSRFRLGLTNPGYTLTGYTVDGTLLDANGNAVTQINHYTGTYTPESDVTLNPIWEVTSGGFRALIHDDAPGDQTNKYTVTLVAEDGTEYPLSSRQYGPNSRTWTVDGVPNGTYTLVTDGYNMTDATKFGQSDTTSDFVINDDGTATVELTFADNKSTTFIRYNIFGEEVVATYPVGIEVRGVNGRRTDDVRIFVQDADGVVFEGSYNEYLQWFTNDELVEGTYKITLQTPSGTYAVINDSVATQAAVATDAENVFTIDLNEETLGNLSAVYGAFQLVEREYQVGVEVRGLDGRRTEDVTIYVQNEDFVVFEGSFNQYSQWLTDEELPAGEYTITLETPDDTLAVINETTQQYAIPTDKDNVFTINLNDETLGTSSAVYGAFQLVEQEYPLGVEVRDLNNRRTSDVEILVEDEDGVVFEGTFDEYNLWTTTEDLPVGSYTITLTTPAGTIAEINDTVATQAAVATDTDNVFTIDVNAETLGSLSRVFGAFRLAEVPVEVEDYFLGIEIRDLDGLRTDAVEIVITNADGDIFEGAYNEYLQWITTQELPVGTYTITLTTPEGTVAVINDTAASQAAVATDTDNVFTIDVNAETLGSLSRVFGAFSLVEVEPTDPDEPGEEPTEPDTPDDEDDTEDPETPGEDPTDPDTPGEEDDTDDPTDPETPEEKEDADDLPKAGVSGSTIGLGITTILSGLGLAFFDKKRKK